MPDSKCLELTYLSRPKWGGFYSKSGFWVPVKEVLDQKNVVLEEEEPNPRVVLRLCKMLISKKTNWIRKGHECAMPATQSVPFHNVNIYWITINSQDPVVLMIEIWHIVHLRWQPCWGKCKLFYLTVVLNISFHITQHIVNLSLSYACVCVCLFMGYRINTN